MRSEKSQKSSDEIVEALSATLEELQARPEELRVQNEELEEARKSLDIERKRYRELFELAPDGYLVTDCGGKIRESNEIAAGLLGIESDLLVGKPLAVYVGSTYKTVFYQLLDALMAEKLDVVRDIELEIRPRGGDPFFSALTIRVIRQEDGSATGLRWLLRDVSERRRQEEALSANSQRLQTKNDELEQWAAATAHDLKEPIRIMALYSGMLKDKYFDEVKGDGEIYLNFISGAATKAMSLIQDLLTFKSVTGRNKMFAPVSLVKPVNEAITNLKAALLESKGEIIFDKLPTVMGDDSQLTQLFYNLLSNGIKFHCENAPVIKISAQKKKSEWLIRIADNGIGFESENAERIFVMFERLNPPSFPGNGIGLALCKKIVENHNGVIWAESEPNVGTSFCFTLPANLE